MIFVSVTDAGLTNTALDTVPTDVARDIWGTGNISGGLIPPMVFTNVLEGENSWQYLCVCSYK